MPRSRSASSAPEAPAAIAIVGPTAAGKTGVGILVAEALRTDVIGCDSRQIYRGLDIGTAKPTAAERLRVRHHLVDVADPGERYSAGRYRDAVLALLPGLRAAGRRPLFVGGTGLYLRAATEDLCPAPAASQDLRAWLGSLARSCPGGLHSLLSRVDPDAAARIHANDRYRTVRALEVFYLTGEALTVRQRRHRAAHGRPATLTYGIAPPAPELRERIRRRLDEMMSAGFLQEARRLREEDWDAALPALRAVGYPQLFAHLDGTTTRDEAIEATRRATWQYARRQLTWFRAVNGIRWVEAAGRSESDIAEEILADLRREGPLA